MTNTEEAMALVQKCLDDWPYAATRVFDIMTRLEKVMELLKDQEPVERKSRTGTNGFSTVWTCGACGSDLFPNNAKAKYCSNCGRAARWE